MSATAAIPGAPNSGVFERLGQSPLLRLLLLGVLSLVLLIPRGAVRGVIAEREATRDAARGEIAQQWGASQQLAGPFLVLPYRTFSTVTKDGKTETVESETQYAVLLPERLSITGTQQSEFRQRGIFRLPVYQTALELSGHFSAPSLAGIDVPDAQVRWQEAQLVLMLSDLKALAGELSLQVNGQDVRLMPGGGKALRGLATPRQDTAALAYAAAEEAPGAACCGGAVHAPLPLAADGGDLRFTLPLRFRGSEALQFVPTGRTTEVALTGDWPSPSFNGAYLPGTREVGDASAPGFRAQWQVPDLSRRYGQLWRAEETPYAALGESAFGLRLFPSVDEYAMAHRATKYAQLFIVLTFAVWWLFEVLASARLHPVQYLLAGVGISLFYLLLLALSEHLGFRRAYLAAAAAVTLQVTLYSWSALHSLKRAAGVGAAMALLYGYLFTVLKDEDYALVTGALGVFVMLSLVMWLTRRVAWNKAAP